MSVNPVSAIDLIEKPYPYNSPFLSVSDDKVVEMLMKSWIVFLGTMSGMQSVGVLPAFPDDTAKMALPSLVLTRVGEDKITLGRVDGYYGVISGQSSNTLSELHGYRYEATYQFDLYTRTLTDQTKYESLIMAGLRRRKSFSSNVIDAIGVSEVPVYDYSVQPSGMLTDIKMKFRCFDNVESNRIPVVWDKQIKQTSYRVKFWCDILQEVSVNRIQLITVSGQLSEE